MSQRGFRDGLWQQIYLGGESFVDRMQAKVRVSGYELTVPRAQRRAPAIPLDVIASDHGNRNAAIVAAYATGAYSYREIAFHFGIHLATVGRIVRKGMQRSET
ncbi:MAG: hypothetical protein ABW148_13245 [Sedimenticola sp.]